MSQSVSVSETELWLTLAGRPVCSTSWSRQATCAGGSISVSPRLPASPGRSASPGSAFGAQGPLAG